eukprot:13966491-Alexandrium_andersonii.AAC.1
MCLPAATPGRAPPEAEGRGEAAEEAHRGRVAVAAMWPLNSIPRQQPSIAQPRRELVEPRDQEHTVASAPLVAATRNATGSLATGDRATWVATGACDR